MSESLSTREPADSILEVDAISLSFKGVQAITDVSFQVGVEELFAIIGPNGAGKTSIFNSISQVYRPQEGDIRWKGESIMGSRPDHVAERGIARTFQNIELFPHMTVLDNLLLGRHIRMQRSWLAGLLWPPRIGRSFAETMPAVFPPKAMTCRSNFQRPKKYSGRRNWVKGSPRL